MEKNQTQTYHIGINLVDFFKMALVVLLIWLSHEFAHWLSCYFMGIEATMSLNTVSPLSGQEITMSQKQVLDASGPLVTILQATIAFFLLKKRWSIIWYTVLFTAFYMRALAGVMNLINLNDEGRLSESLGLGTFTIVIGVVGFLFLLFFLINKRYKIKKKTNVITYLIIMVVSSIIILSDQFLKIQLIPLK